MKFKAYFPFTRWFPMSRQALAADAVAGLTVALVLIPQAMAYAELAGLPVWAGLYAAMLPVMLAGLWGSSNHLQTGPGATMGLVVASTLMPLAAVGSAEYLALATQLAFMVGVLWALLAVFRLGFFMNFLSRPVIEGFINAGGMLIAISQVGKIFGLERGDSGHVLTNFFGLFARLDGINPTSLIMGGATIGLLLLAKRFVPKWPAALLLAAVATAVVHVLGLGDPERVAKPVAIVGHIPPGLPKPVWPVPDFDDFARLLPGALIFALVGFMETCSVARGVASRSHQKLDVNREAVGQSLASFATAFSGGQPVNGSFSRTALNYASGARTGLSTVFTGLFVFAFLLLAATWFHDLPKTVLSAIIIVAVVNLMNFKKLASYFKTRRSDGVAAWATFIGTLAFAPELEKGILLGATFAILAHLYNMMRPHVALLGRHPDGALRDADLHGLEVDRNLPAVRFDGRLFFANASFFEERVLATRERFPRARHLVIVFDGINAIDASGTEMLIELAARLGKQNVELLFVGVKNQVFGVMTAGGLVDAVGEHNFFGTFESARAEVYARLPSDLSYAI